MQRPGRPRRAWVLEQREARGEWNEMEVERSFGASYMRLYQEFGVLFYSK